MEEPVTYADVVRVNVRALRERAGLSQNDLAARMQALGFPWHGPTSNSLEQGRRYPHVAELAGLAFALGEDIPTLLDPAGPGFGSDRPRLKLGNAETTLRHHVARSVVRADVMTDFRTGSVIRWNRNEPVWAEGSGSPDDNERLETYLRKTLADRGLAGDELEAEYKLVRGLVEHALDYNVNVGVTLDESGGVLEMELDNDPHTSEGDPE